MIVRVLMDGRAVDLGSLGSYHNECFFGHIRKLTDDQSIESFMHACQKATLLGVLRRKFSLNDVRQYHKGSMAGAKIPGDPCPELPQVGWHACRALSLWNLTAKYGCMALTARIEGTINEYARATSYRFWTEANEPLDLITVSLREEGDQTPEAMTLRKMDKISTDGMKCYSRFASSQQIDGGS